MSHSLTYTCKTPGFAFLAAPIVITVAVLLTRWRSLRLQGSVQQLALYTASLVLQHVSVAAAITVVALALPNLWPLGGALCGLYALLLGADAAMLVGSGFRLETSMVAMLGQLRELAQGKPIKRMVTGGLVAVLSAAALGAWAWAPSKASAAPSTTGLGSMTVMAAATAAVLAMTIAIAAYEISRRIMRALPIVFTYAWSNTVILHVAMSLQAMRARREKRHTARGNLPLWLLPQNEEATVPDVNYPLFRKTLGFTGKTHFTVKKAAEEKPHVVVIMLETFAARDVGVLGGKHNASPHFDALAKEGILWTNFHANGTITSRSEMAALYGTIVPFSQPQVQHEAPAKLRGLPHIFRDLGYHTAFMQAGALEWEGSRNFHLTRGGFDQMFGQDVLCMLNPQAKASDWSFDDKFLFDFHAEWLKKQDAEGTPSFSCIQTITNHFPFKLPDDAQAFKHDVPAGSQYADFLQTFMYTDKCLGDYMATLRREGLDRKTIFYVMGDHGNIITDSGQAIAGAPCNQLTHVPLVCYAPGRLSPAVIDEVASQVDLLPTILDALDISATHHAMGTSMRRVCPTRHAVSNHSFAPTFTVTRFDRFRHWYAFGTDQTSLYDASCDVQEAHDVKAAHPQLASVYAADARSMRNAIAELFKEDRLCPPAQGVQKLAINVTGAPWFVPRNADALPATVARICSEVGQLARTEYAAEVYVLMVITTMDMPAELKTTSMQLVFKALRPEILGCMTDREKALANSMLEILRLHPSGRTPLEAASRRVHAA